MQHARARSALGAAVAILVTLLVAMPAGAGTRRDVERPAGELLKYRLSSLDMQGPRNGWAVGVRYYHWLYATQTEHWDGTTWSAVRSPNPSPGHPNSLLDVSVASAHDVWAVGYFDTAEGSRPLVLHWDGTRWTHVLVHGVTAQYSDLMAVYAISGTDAWAVGKYWDDAHNDVPMILHWDGSTWRIWHQSDPGYGWFFGMDGTSSNDIWAVGRQYATGGPVQTLAMHWNGTAWSKVNTPNPPDSDNGSSFESVVASRHDDAWAVGEGYGSHGRTTGITEHWDGSAWTLVGGATGDRFVGPTLLGAGSTGPGDVWAVGGIGYPGKIFTEHFDGTSWQRVPCPNPYGRWTSLTGIDPIAPDDVWAVGYAPGKLHHKVFMHWNGTAWSAWH